MGRGRKGHKASEFRESKFRRQGSRRQMSRASKEMNPSFLSDGFITAIVVNSPERKLAKHTSVHCSTAVPDQVADGTTRNDGV